MSVRSGATQDFSGGRLVNVGLPINPNDVVTKAFTRYDWPTSCVGQPGAGEIFPYFLVPVIFTLPVNLAGSRSRTITAASASATWTLYRLPVGSQSASAIATATFPANALSANFAMASAITFAVDDILYWQAPNTQDSTMSDVAFTLVGAR